MAKKTKPKPITAEEFDERFEAGESMDEYLDWDKATKFVNVEFPLWMVRALDAEAARLGVARQAIIKMWIDEKLTERGRTKKAPRGKDETG